MPKEARERARRYRIRADECLQLRDLAAEPPIRGHYEQIADGYLSLADAEEALADRQKERDAALKRPAKLDNGDPAPP